MPTHHDPTPRFRPLADEAKSLCTAHQCPLCGTHEQVTAERVIVGTVSVTQCHCRACGHSWHPQIDGEVL
jgi:transcription elongation factor Elf1